MAQTINQERRERNAAVKQLRRWIRQMITAAKALDRFLESTQGRKIKDLDRNDLSRILDGLSKINEVADFLFKAIEFIRQIFKF